MEEGLLVKCIQFINMFLRVMGKYVYSTYLSLFPVIVPASVRIHLLTLYSCFVFFPLGLELILWLNHLLPSNFVKSEMTVWCIS